MPIKKVEHIKYLDNQSCEHDTLSDAAFENLRTGLLRSLDKDTEFKIADMKSFFEIAKMNPDEFLRLVKEFESEIRSETSNDGKNLFKWGDFCLSSGIDSKFKIDCDALTNDDWDTIAQIGFQMLASRGIVFGKAIGIPRGGNKLASRMRKFEKPSENNHPLIVDDVITTGETLKKYKDIYPGAPALVAFSRMDLGGRQNYGTYAVFQCNWNVGE